jgi:hypothetical protein
VRSHLPTVGEEEDVDAYTDDLVAEGSTVLRSSAADSRGKIRGGKEVCHMRLIVSLQRGVSYATDSILTQHMNALKT